jgi:hypothetical protein
MEAGARGLMAAYNEIDGIPNANNEDLLYEHPRNVRILLLPSIACGLHSSHSLGVMWSFRRSAMGIRRLRALR